MSAPDSKPSAEVSPEFKAGCMSGLIGVCLLLALPRFALALGVLGLMMMALPAYIVLPIGRPKGPSGLSVDRPTYGSEKRLLAVALLAFMGVMGWAGLQRDIHGAAKSGFSRPKPATSVASLQNKTLKTPTLLAANEDAFRNANDKASAQAYMARGELWVLEAATSVKVTDPGLLSSEVLVLSGPHLGKTGLVVSEAVR